MARTVLIARRYARNDAMATRYSLSPQRLTAAACSEPCSLRVYKPTSSGHTCLRPTDRRRGLPPSDLAQRTGAAAKPRRPRPRATTPIPALVSTGGRASVRPPPAVSAPPDHASIVPLGSQEDAAASTDHFQSLSYSVPYSTSTTGSNGSTVS